MAGRVEGKVAIVSGGVGGLGEAQVRRFLAEGACVVVADIRRDEGRALVDELGADAAFAALDVTSPDDWVETVAATVARWGRVDILVNTAGIGIVGAIDEVPFEEHRRVIDVNVHGVHLGMRTVSGPMRRQAAGSIVNMSSINGLAGVRNMSSYGASKFAVTGMTRAAAIDLGPAGIRVNSVHPGAIATPMITPEVLPSIEALVAPQPIARLGRPEEVAAAVLFLAGDEASYITGSQLVIDGGHLAGPFRGVHV